MTEVSKPIEKVLNIGLVMKIIWLASMLLTVLLQKLLLPVLGKAVLNNSYEKTDGLVGIPYLMGAVLVTGIYLLFWYLMKAHCKQRNQALVFTGVVCLIGIFAVSPILLQIASILSTRIAAFSDGISAVGNLSVLTMWFSYLSYINEAADVLFVAAFALLCYRNCFVSEA